MESYTNFAGVYDTFMDNVPYDDWVAYLKALLDEYGAREGIVLDLGCGTGSVTERLADLGYDMIGIDNSQDMLEIARQKNMDNDSEILYLLQDMREFELYGTVQAVVSLCDSMNYITEEEELLEVFRLVNNYLDPGGIFIFDLNTEYKYRELLGDSTIAESRDECSFIWWNYYDEEAQINEYELTIFAKQEEGELYQRFQEYHYQRAYGLELIRVLIEESGLEFVGVYEAMTKDVPKEETERVYIIARECGKTLKNDELN